MVVTPAAFTASTSKAAPPPDLSLPLQALWWAKKGEWEKAHGIVMSDESRAAAWVHAYLHRVEGDLPNAGYWYRTARRPVASEALDREWSEIVAALLGGT